MSFAVWRSSGGKGISPFDTHTGRGSKPDAETTNSNLKLTIDSRTFETRKTLQFYLVRFRRGFSEFSLLLILNIFIWYL